MRTYDCSVSVLMGGHRFKLVTAMARFVTVNVEPLREFGGMIVNHILYVMMSEEREFR